MLAAVGALWLALAWGSVAFAYEYQAVAIPPLSAREASTAFGINNQGQVVGRSYNVNPTTGAVEDREGFIWDVVNGARALITLSGQSGPWGLNEAGRASGYSYNQSGEQRAVWWNVSSNQITDIGTLTNPNTQASGPTSTAYGINGAGLVVGSADIPNDAGDFTPFHAFLYNPASGIQDLGTLTTAWPQWQNGYSIAYDINGQENAVGIASDDSFAYLPFVYNSTDGMRALARNPSYSSGEWYAVAINDSGMIAGHVIAATNQSLPHYWPNAAATPIAIQMPAGFPYGEIYRINSAGQMVGIMWSSDQADAVEHAFIFDTVHGVRDLNDLIAPQSGWVLTYARDINDQGQVVGLGDLNGAKRGFVLTALPPSGDLTGDGKPDVLWQDATTGDVYLWTMNGTTQTGGAFLARNMAPWKVVGTADLTGDGKPDLLWQDATSGDVYLWTMNGTTQTGGGYLAQGMGPWKVVGPR
jgi:probable HAF family extracellular repeat protein